jgi:hypothetical protein
MFVRKIASVGNGGLKFGCCVKTRWMDVSYKLGQSNALWIQNLMHESMRSGITVGYADLSQRAEFVDR